MHSNAGAACAARLAQRQNTVNALACTSIPTRSVACGAIAAALLLVALLGGCAAPATRPGGGAPVTGSPGGEPSPGPATSRPAPPAPVVSPLVTEQRWLDEWFRGTPVVIAMADSSTLGVDVPLINSFDAGSSRIKPALAAVLDRVATSLRRQPAMRVSIAAPADANGPAALAASRAQQVREHLVARNVAATRLGGAPAVRAGSALQLRIVIAAQPISRLNDATLPVPVGAVKPVAATPASAAKR